MNNDFLMPIVTIASILPQPQGFGGLVVSQTCFRWLY